MECPLGTAYQRYWEKLSLDERQMQLDAEGLYSMDLQEVALRLALHISSPRVVDAFCGIGGAAIAFARAGKSVQAIEIDPSRLDMARHNAQLFRVEDRIRFQQGDAMHLLRPSDSALYLDPPWGGPTYGKVEKFSLKFFLPHGADLLRRALSVSNEVLFKLPKNFDFAELTPLRKPTEILSNEYDGKLEYYTAVFRHD